MNTYALIMAGGEGTRFYPISTPDKPKQFLELYDNASLLQHTFNRINPLIKTKNTFIATNQRYLKLVQEQLGEIDCQQVIGEPVKKNTAPCIALVAWLISQIDPEAVMCVFPADHFIGQVSNFHSELSQAIVFAQEHDQLITLGIPPTWPSTEYGYINRGPGMSQSIFSVEKFVEKPCESLAKEYLDNGNYLWNSGIFIWKAKVILNEIKKYLPDLHASLDLISKTNGASPDEHIKSFFHDVKSISIDYGVLEKSDSVCVLEADFSWSDLGTFDSLKRVAQKGNIQLSQEILTQYETLNENTQLNNELPKKIDKPWGFEEIWALTDQYVGKFLNIKKGHRLSYQYHLIKEESICVLSGEMDFEFEIDGIREIKRLRSGESFHIPPKMKHRMIGVTDCKIMEVSTPHLEDVVRLEDAYGRLDDNKH